MSFDPYDHPDSYITFSVEKDGILPESSFDPTCHARTALFGVMYWYDLETPQPPLPDFPPELMGKLTAWDTGKRLVGPDEADTLLMLAVSACERNWNKTPELATGEDAEEKALSLLKWIRKNGNITKLKIRGEEYEVET